jgi:hypothetical protein
MRQENGKSFIVGYYRVEQNDRVSSPIILARRAFFM